MSKELKASKKCSFTYPLEKGADTFSRVQGIIGGFNKLVRNISSGVKNTADELMGSKYFWTTPKDNLPHY